LLAAGALPLVVVELTPNESETFMLGVVTKAKHIIVQYMVAL
jgi:hypothetical protein